MQLIYLLQREVHLYKNDVEQEQKPLLFRRQGRGWCNSLLLPARSCRSYRW
ncbi:hypothetical protein [Pontibacter actiniarum]|uniref:hypothetical protein n=1 Tax=Pontibacter actiniarum TaxID=323450 RepID=UPI0003FD4263|nr:hypothetical protein [Pontibacter actiniarum]